MKPLVSIIIPCFNADDCVESAIESALAQDYSRVEVICIDDGSTDGTLEVIQSFGERVKWAGGPNEGGCAARNRGIGLARGEFIQFLDADDVLFPEKVARMLPVPHASRREIVFSDFTILDSASGKSVLSPRPSGHPARLEYMLEAERLSISAPLYPVSALEEIGGFDERLACAQEYDLNLRLAVQGWRFRRLPEVLYQVRTRAGSVSSNYDEVLRQQDAIFQKLIRQNREQVFSQAELLRLLSWRYIRNARLFTRSGDLESANLAVARARKLDIHAGIDLAFSRKTRGLAQLLGPIRAEKIIRALVALGAH